MDPSESQAVSQSARESGSGHERDPLRDQSTNPSYRAIANPALVALIVATTIGAGVGAVLHPRSKYRFKAEAIILIEPTSAAERRAAVARLDDLRKEIFLPHVADAARRQSGATGNLLERVELEDGPLHGVRIVARDQSRAGAATLANAFVSQALNFPAVEAADLSLSDFESGLGRWGSTRSVFSAPPTAMRVVSETPREGLSSLRVVCSGDPGCGTSLLVTYSFRRGITFTASAWLRSVSGKGPITLVLGPNAKDYATGGGRLRSTWTQYSVEWTPTRSATGAELAIQLGAARAATFDVDDVMLTEQRAVGGSQSRLGERARAEQALTIVPAVPSGTTGDETVRWALVGGGLGLLVAVGSIALGRLARRRRQ